MAKRMELVFCKSSTMTITNEETHKLQKEKTAKKTTEVVRIDFSALKQDLNGLVGTTVEETLNGRLESKAKELCQARCDECRQQQQAHRNGSYQRNLHTGAGEVNGSKVARGCFQTQIIERYRRRESSVEEALV